MSLSIPSLRSCKEKQLVDQTPGFSEKKGGCIAKTFSVIGQCVSGFSWSAGIAQVVTSVIETVWTQCRADRVAKEHLRQGYGLAHRCVNLGDQRIGQVIQLGDRQITESRKAVERVAQNGIDVIRVGVDESVQVVRTCLFESVDIIREGERGMLTIANKTFLIVSAFFACWGIACIGFISGSNHPYFAVTGLAVSTLGFAGIGLSCFSRSYRDEQSESYAGLLQNRPVTEEEEFQRIVEKFFVNQQKLDQTRAEIDQCLSRRSS